MYLTYNIQICIHSGLYLPLETYFRAYNTSFEMFLPQTSSPMRLAILGHILTKIINV